MATITVRNIPDEVVERLKRTAAAAGISMEQEVRELLKARYATRAVILDDIRRSWESMPPTSAEELESWRDEGRP